MKIKINWVELLNTGTSFFLAFLIGVMPLLAHADAPGKVVDGSITPGFTSNRNFVINPIAERNVNNVTAVGATVVRQTSAPFEVAKFQITPSAAGQTVTWALNQFDRTLYGSMCESTIIYYGDATYWSWSVLQAGSLVVPAQQMVSSFGLSGAVGTATINFPCGNAVATTTATLTTTNAAAQPLSIGKVYVGKATNSFQNLLNGAPTNIVRFTSGSGTYTPSVGVTSIEVIMAGGGGGGGGAATAYANSTNAGAGTSTTFGSSFLTAGGGTGGGNNNGYGVGAGGGVIVNSPAVSIFSQSGTYGSVQTGAAAGSQYSGGGMGGGNPLTPGQGVPNGSAYAPIANTGAGGSGAAQGGTSGFAGTGGGAGGYIDALITGSNIAASYAYTVGTGGTAGVGNIYNGTAGSAGVILIKENFNSITTQAFQASNGGISAGQTVTGAWSSCPQGTILQDGSAVSRTQYPGLFAAIGTTYGTGDGSTTFNLPSVPSATAQNEFQSYTMTLGSTGTVPVRGTVLVENAKWRRSGDLMEIIYTYRQNAAGTAGTGSALFSLPPGYTADATKVPLQGIQASGSAFGFGGALLGDAQVSITNSGDGQYSAPSTATLYNSTQISIATASSQAGAQYPLGNSSAVGYGIANLWISFHLFIPVTQWAGQTLKSCIYTQAASAAPVNYGGVQSNDNTSGITAINSTGAYTGAATIPTSIDTVNCNAASAAVTLTMPDASLNKSKRYYLKKVDTTTNLCNFASVSSQTFMTGITVMKMGTYGDNVSVVSDGANWQVENFNINTAATYAVSASRSVASGAALAYDLKIDDPLGSMFSGTWSGYYPGRYKATVVEQTSVGTTFYAKLNGNSIGYVNYCGAGLTCSGAVASARSPNVPTLAIIADAAGTLSGPNGTGILNQVTFERVGN